MARVLDVFANVKVCGGPYRPHAWLGELQTLSADGDAGGVVFFHHANWVPDQHPCLGARRLQIHRFHEDRYAPVRGVPSARELSSPSDLPLLMLGRP